MKPEGLFGRDAEWSELASFMSPDVDCLRLGVVYGSRQGKSEMRGGVPGYKELTAATPVPRTVEDLASWLAATVFNQSHAMFDEVDVLFSQEPGIKDRAMYYGILATVASGESTPARIAAKLNRDPRTIAYPLGVLRRAGFVSYEQDALVNRKPVVSITDPILRFHHTITIPRFQLFERRSMVARAWADARHTFFSQILGPYCEHLARKWTITSMSERTGLAVGWTGTSSVACRQDGISHQLDAVSLAAGDMPRTSLRPTAWFSFDPGSSVGARP